MRISDWSSDVCSSDLTARQGRLAGRGIGQGGVMNRCARGLLACAILAWSFWTPASASVVFESKLREADAIRTSDPVKFQRILTDLAGLADSAPKRHREDRALIPASHMLRTVYMQGATGKSPDLQATS